MRPERRGEAGPGVAADVGDDVGAVTDPAQRGPRHRQHRPAHLVTVGAGQHPCRTGPPSAGPQQGQRCRRAEPHGFDVPLPDQSTHPCCRRRVPAASACRGGGPSRDPFTAGLFVIHRPRPSIAARTPSPGGRRLPPAGHQILQVGLNAPAARRKVVGYQQHSAVENHFLATLSWNFVLRNFFAAWGQWRAHWRHCAEHGIGSGTEHLAQRRGYADVARGARAQIQPAQRLRAVTVGDEPGEQPRVVVCRRQLRGTAGEVVVGGQRGRVSATGPAGAGRPT